MRTSFTNSPFTIDAGTAYSGIASRRQTLQIVSGAAWVTVEGEPHDYWLSTGDTLPIAPHRLVVLEAGIHDCCVATSVPARSTLPGKLAALLTLLSRLPRTWRNALSNSTGGDAQPSRSADGACTCTAH